MTSVTENTSVPTDFLRERKLQENRKSLKLTATSFHAQGRPKELSFMGEILMMK